MWSRIIPMTPDVFKSIIKHIEKTIGTSESQLLSST